MLIVIMLVFMGISFAVQSKLKSKFKKYSKMQLWSNLSGAEVAQKMLHDHGIHDVTITHVGGKLTDHYNPSNKTVNLSEEVYHGRHAAATAVAAHEVGHAVQHAQAYAWLGFRSAMVPITNISSQLMNAIFTLSIFGVFAFSMNMQVLILIIIAAQAVITLFSLVTLPVEYDASARALKWIKAYNVVTDEEHDAAKDALKWAARTYLVAAIASVVTLLYYVLSFMGGDD